MQMGRLGPPETACPTWSQLMTAQRPGKVHPHFGQLSKCRWVVWGHQRHACPTWSQLMTAQRPGKVHLHLASSQNADGSSGATRDCMPDLKPANDSTAPRESPSAFWPAPKMQMGRLGPPETACPTWSQQMTAQCCGKVHLHFGQPAKCRWVVWYPARTPAHHCPSPAFLPDAIYLRFRQL